MEKETQEMRASWGPGRAAWGGSEQARKITTQWHPADLVPRRSWQFLQRAGPRADCGVRRTWKAGHRRGHFEEEKDRAVVRGEVGV